MNLAPLRTVVVCMLAAVALVASSGRALATSGQWFQEQTLLPFATQSNARFGSAVGMHGEVAIVGMPYADYDGHTNCGIAYVWHRDNGVWHLSHGLVSQAPQSSAYFGSTTVVRGDRLYVGAPGFDPPASGGLIEQLQFDGTPWPFYQSVGGAAGDRNGSAIAEDHGLVAAGAPGPCETCGVHGRSGKVQVTYDYDDSAYNTTIYGPDINDDEHFGASVAVYRSPVAESPDLLVVGAPHFRSDGIGDDIGAAYVYANATHQAGDWQQVASLHATPTIAGDLFGLSVAVGANRVIVGAPDRDRTTSGGPISNAGAVFVFVPDGGGGWQLESQIFLADPAAGELLGSAVAYDPVHDRVFGGAPQRLHTVFGDSGATGSVSVFKRVLVLLPDHFGWISTAEMYSFDAPTVGQQTGQSLSVSGDRLFVGAPGYDANANNGIVDSGRVLVFAADDLFADGFQ